MLGHQFEIIPLVTRDRNIFVLNISDTVRDRQLVKIVYQYVTITSDHVGDMTQKGQGYDRNIFEAYCLNNRLRQTVASC